jgi:hypothetical protein
MRRGAGWQETVPLAVLDGDQPGSGWGEVLAALDANGDGSDELVIAAPRWNAGGGSEGLVRVHRGDAGPFTDPLFPPMLPGYSLLSMGGDFDGDGFDDLLVRDSDILEVVRGSPAGPVGTTDGYTAILQLQGLIPAAADVGDLNADGYDDLVFTSRSCGSCPNNPERVGVYLGSSAGLSSAPSWLFIEQNIRGYAIGDLDGDGFEELLLQRTGPDEIFPGTTQGPSSTPMQVIDLGVIQAVSRGDVNGDGLADVVILDSTSTPRELVIYLGFHGGLMDPGWTIPVPLAGTPPAYLPDLNGDGFDDLPIGSITTHGESGEGGIRVFLGSPSGPVEAQGLELNASSTGANVASSNSRERLDVDGDGREDVLVRTSGLADNGAAVQFGLRLQLGSAGGLRSLALWGDEASDAFFGDTDGDGRLEIGYLSFTAGGRRFVEVR